MARTVVDDDGGPTVALAGSRPPGRTRGHHDAGSRSGAAPGSRATLEYRPALDGLRAVAVVAVMAHHAGLRLPGSAAPLVPGGFLGVDVFLVISGYLITSLLLVERERTGRVDLRAFWLRRARRLLPAVLVMVVGVAVMIGATDLPVDVFSARGDALAGLAYVANWRFVLTEQSYFASFGLPSPFRHLWSLSLEEQWYLLFPPVLVVAVRVCRRRPALLLTGLLGGVLASAAWMAVAFTPGRDPSRAYYGTDTRAHTLLVGAALAVVATGCPRVVARLARVSSLVAVGGVAALAVLFHAVEGTEPGLYRGGFLLVAVASAAAVAGVALPGARGPAWWLLGRRSAVVVGRLSYSLYLWHWPLFIVLTPERVGIGGAELVVVRFLASFALAGASYVVVEQPVCLHGLVGLSGRMAQAGLPRVRPGMLAAVAGVGAVTVVVVSTAGGGGRSALARSSDTTSTSSGRQPITTVVVEPGHPLPAVPPDGDLRVMVEGDSVAWSLAFPLVMERTAPEGLRLSVMADLGCTVTPGEPVVDGVVFEGGACDDWRASSRRVAFDSRPDVVVALWGPWEVYDHRAGDRDLVAGTPEFAAAYQQSLAASIDEVISVSPDTRFAFLAVPCMDERAASLGGVESPRNDRDQLAWINDRTAEVAERHGERAMVVDLGPLLCPGGEPVGEVNGQVARADGVHITPAFAPTAWRYIEERIRPWLAQPAVTPTG